VLEYSVQATPFIIRDLGWKFIKELAAQAYPLFEDGQFRRLVFGSQGTQVLDTVDPDKIKVIFAQIEDRAVMIAPYRDEEGIKVLYFKWVEETLYDSFCVPDGQNRVWDNREKP
jgi:hypothetical protein